MIISLNWLKKFTDIDMPVDKLVELIGARLVEVESVTDLGKKYESVLIVKVIDAKPLEGSDHLSLVKINDGGKVDGLERDDDDYVQVVCGAPNIATGQNVVWLPPKSIVPSTFDTAEPFKLDTRNLRGVTSNGMIASAKELDLFYEHTGILVIDEEVAPGTEFAKQYEFDDSLLDIENKSLTHRPDCFGIIGFAREIAAITGKQFTSPDWVLNLAPHLGEAAGSISVQIDDPELSDRYQAIVMSEGDSKKQSPMMIQTYLSRVGVRPISSVVDVTNYLMMLTGQPLHAFDFDKVKKIAGDNVEIHVRAGRDGEKLALLDGREIKLTVDDIVIAAGDTAIALAGAMGGSATEIDENTKSIIIESATFNLYKLRSTQMRHGIFSEAITRFTKGQPAQLTAPVLGEAVRLVGDWAGMQVSTSVADAYPGKKQGMTISAPLQRVNNILGTDINIADATDLIGRAEFGVNVADQLTMDVTVPYWRNDIHIIEDIVEEIGRLNGFDNIKPTLPMRDFTAVTISDFDVFRTDIRKILVRSGANEVLNYSFVHGDMLEKAALDPKDSYKIVNSISPDLQYYRQSLTPNLLGLIHPNIKQGFDKFALFEINKCHRKSEGVTDEGVPVEIDRLSAVGVSKSNVSGAAYYRAKRFLNYLCKSFNLELDYKKLEVVDDSITLPFEPRRSALVVDNDGNIIGVVGEYKKLVAKGFKLPEYVAGFEIDTRALFAAVKKVGKTYVPASRFPATERDICFKVAVEVSVGNIIKAAKLALATIDLQTSVNVIDIYQSENDETKNITIRIKLVAFDHTLTGDEVSGVIKTVVDSVVVLTKAIVI
ncbi:MAG: phenylalanine--tRNA ligase subunit beta [Candidatus Saccharibacteria bacterium]